MYLFSPENKYNTMPSLLPVYKKEKIVFIHKGALLIFAQGSI